MARAHALDVLVIGAGQAGLATACYLRPSQATFQVVDANAQLGDSWRKRYDSLVLFTPRRYSALPGLPLPGDPQGYPSKDELAGYLADYAAHFDLPIRLQTAVQRLEREGDLFRATTAGGEPIAARAVVIATGGFQEPAVPPLARQFSPEVAQFSPASYRNPRQIPEGTVLVVGDGATGRQIALELAASHSVWLAASGRPEPMPDRLLGQSIFWWLERLGLLLASRESFLGRQLMKTDAFPGKNLRLPRLRKHGVRVVGRLQQAAAEKAQFATGETAAVDAVIWATGYRDRTEWVALPEAKDEQGQFRHRRGLSPVPNLYFVGRNWQWTQGSSRLYGVGADARYVVNQALAQLAAQASPVPALGTL